VAAEGAIALCTELEAAPGPSLMRLAEARDLEAALAEINHDQSFDSAAAAQLGRALQKGPVYLLSGLDDEIIEQLGMAPVSGAEQIVRLVRRTQSCLVVAGAQYGVPVIGDEP
jgi:hypothetical protein